MGRATAVLLVATIFLSFALPALASDQYCFDDSTLLSTTDVYNGSDWNNTTTYRPCPIGCNNMTFSCNPDPLSEQSTSMFYFLFPITALVLILLISFTANPIEDWPLYLLVIGISLLLLIVPFGTLSSAMPNYFSAPYQLLTVGLVIVMIYYVLILLSRAVRHAQKVR